MATTKPTKPSITLPSAFGTSPSNVKTPYTAQELVDGYSASIQQILDGGNVNWLNDTFFKFLTYTTAICDWLNGTPAKKIPFINSSNQLDYMDAPSGNIIGQIISCDCTASYVPDGCLPCDGQEYAKSQFSDLWTNFLTSSPAKLNVCTYEDYQSDISSKGFCDKIAIDEDGETFKVPTLNNKVYQGSGSTFAVKGDGMSLGITNGTEYGSIAPANDTAHRLYSNTELYGKTIGTTKVSGNHLTSDKALGITTDPTKSGIIAENNTKEATSLRYFIVVSTGQLNQALMDWSAWASSLAGKMDKNASNITAQAKATISGWGMPSDRYIDLTLGASGGEYTAPANGYFCLHKKSSASNQYILIQRDSKSIQVNSSGSSQDWGVIYPVKGGQSVNIYYNFGSTTNSFRFYYAEGEQNV